MKTSTCCTCGHSWPTGTNGDHSCSEHLGAHLRELRHHLSILAAEDSQCEPDWVQKKMAARRAVAKTAAIP